MFVIFQNHKKCTEMKIIISNKKKNMKKMY